MKVVKFGGGCLRDAEGFLRAAGLILDESPSPAVVVSAVHGITDLLLDAVSAVGAVKSPDSAFVREFRERHVQLVRQAVCDPKIRSAALRTIDRIGERVDRLLRGIALVGEVTPSVRAHILSCGERLAAHIFAAVLEGGGGAARVYETDLLGLTAERGYEGVSVDWDASGPALDAASLEIGGGAFIPVFTGFFGRAADGRVATFGRNGSDYSAAVLARGLGAETLEFWKDTEGFMTADPRWVARARPIPRLSAAAAAELSYFGARILHPRVFEPLEGTTISVRIRSFADPERPGTVILSGPPDRESGVLCVTAYTNAAFVRILGPGVGVRPGVIGAVGSRLAAAGVNILTVLTAQTAINLLIDRDDAARSREVLAGWAEDTIRSVEIVDDAAIVAVVGESLEGTPGVAGRFFGALGRAGIGAVMAAAGASASAVYGVVKREEALPAVQALHAEFFNEDVPVVFPESFVDDSELNKGRSLPPTASATSATTRLSLTTESTRSSLTTESSGVDIFAPKQ